MTTQAKAAQKNGAVQPCGQPSAPDRPDRFAAVDAILARRGYRRAELIGVLQDIQESYHYLPEELLTYVATALGTTPATVFGVATFYAQFSLEPKGEYVVRVCDGTACHVKNSQGIFAALRKRLKLTDGSFTTPDRKFTLEVVRCLGACGIAPVMVINEQVHPQLTPEAATLILDTLVKRESGSDGNGSVQQEEGAR